MTPRVASTWAAFTLLVLGSPVSAQVTPLGTPYLSGCGQEFRPAIFALGEPKVGNAGFGILGEGFPIEQNLPYPCAPAIRFLLVGTCASTPIPAANILPTCSSLPGGCLAYIDQNGPVFAFFGQYLYPIVPLTPSTSNGDAVVRMVWSFPIPSDPSLVGGTVCAQAVTRAAAWGTSCPPAPLPCVSVSNGLSITILP